MKNSHTCPKCQSTDITIEKGEGIFKEKHNYIRISFVGMVALDRYICLQCGYTEEWVQKQKDLDRVAKKLRKNIDYDGYV